MKRCLITLLTAFVLFLVWSAVVLAVEPSMKKVVAGKENIVDGPIARRQLQSQAQSLLYQEKFDELEKMAQELRKTKAMFPEGVWKLHFFYMGLSPKVTSPEGWKSHLNLVDKWLQKSPSSITARIAAAVSWEFYGADARGKGYANEVSDEGWRKLGESFRNAHQWVEIKPS